MKTIAHTTVMDAAITVHIAVLSGVAMLKWLVPPSAAATTMMTISATRPTTVTVPRVQKKRLRRCRRLSSQDSETE